mmetsp:Transcript_20462/g.49790  ORF Transcript_20462/g.49790 Transcript_20462/m.49790 type:complete len:87 (+) Transcript_20462:590-850(+)
MQRSIYQSASISTRRHISTLHGTHDARTKTQYNAAAHVDMHERDKNAKARTSPPIDIRQMTQPTDSDPFQCMDVGRDMKEETERET